MQLIATRHYHDYHPVTREEFELQDRMYSVNRRSTGTPYRHPKGTPLIGVLCW